MLLLSPLQVLLSKVATKIKKIHHVRTLLGKPVWSTLRRYCFENLVCTKGIAVSLGGTIVKAEV